MEVELIETLKGYIQRLEEHIQVNRVREAVRSAQEINDSMKTEDDGGNHVKSLVDNFEMQQMIVELRNENENLLAKLNHAIGQVSHQHFFFLNATLHIAANGPILSINSKTS